MSERRCSHCKEFKPVSEFYVRANQCKICSRDTSRRSYIKHKDKITKRHKKWIADNRERHNEIALGYYYRKGKKKRLEQAAKKYFKEMKEAK